MGNKIDVEESERDVSRERGAEEAENLYVDQDQISALDGTGFDHMFETIVRKLQSRRHGVLGQSTTFHLPCAFFSVVANMVDAY